MYVPFESLPEESRIWIYQSSRKFSDEEIADIKNDLEEFLNNWSAHGSALEASYEIKYNRFMLLFYSIPVPVPHHICYAFICRGFQESNQLLIS